MDNSQQITADFNLGVPSVEDETYPAMTLLHQDGQTEMNIVDSVIVGISIPLVITGE